MITNEEKNALNRMCPASGKTLLGDELQQAQLDIATLQLYSPTTSEKTAIFVPAHGEQKFGLTDLTKGGANDPTIITYRGLKLNEFGVNDELWFEDELDHDYKEGTNLLLHVHWTPRDRATAENGKTVAWKIDFSVFNVDSAIPAAPTTYDLTVTCNGVDHVYQYSASVPVVGTGLKISAAYQGRVYRDSGDSWVGSSSGQLPLLCRVGLHYQRDAFGSAQEFLKS